MSIHDVDAVAATAGPGLIGGVMVALLAGKGLALAAGKPLIAVNHLEGHALVPRLADPDLDFPYLLLLVSGGHCQLLEVRGVGDYRRLATTIDDAAGEAFDKTAKLLGLGYPGGPAVEELAKDGDPDAVPLPRPLVGSGEPHFSFAGLKSAVQRAVASGDFRPEDIAASFQQAVVDCLVDRTRRALEQKRRAGAGRRRRRCREPGDPRRARRARAASRAAGSASRRLAVHRQCGDDRLGRRRALRRRADSTASTRRRARAGRSTSSAEKVRGAGVKA